MNPCCRPGIGHVIVYGGRVVCAECGTPTERPLSRASDLRTEMDTNPENRDCAEITRISIARLHNRGNYEHSRYEVTVALSSGADQGAVFRELEEILEALDPQPPVFGYHPDIDYYRRRVAEYAAKEAAGASIEPHQKAEREEAIRACARWDEWKANREAALARFTALGGVARFTDAKQKWDDEDQP